MLSNPLYRLAPMRLRLQVLDDVSVRMARIDLAADDKGRKILRRADFPKASIKKVHREVRSLYRKKISYGDYAKDTQVGSMILIMILGAVISWAVQRWLDERFPR